MADSSKSSLPQPSVDRLPNSATVYVASLKRVLDIVLVVLLSVGVIPLMAAIASLVLVCNGRPILFRQARFGMNGTPFDVVKFRTMSISQSHDSTITISGDSRITGLGRYLRRFKLDELPQLWNVASGHMSFVGPRPDMPHYVDQIPPKYRSVLRLKPGITGLATIAFRNEEYLLENVSDAKDYNDRVMFPLKLAINEEYLHRMTPVFDLKCMIATIFPSYASTFGFQIFSSIEEVDAEFKKRRLLDGLSADTVATSKLFR